MNKSANRFKTLSKKGKIIVLASPSGGGKSTMTKRLLKDFKNIRFSVSATTRKPREGEKDGVHYHFISKKDFLEKIDAGEFLEWEEFYNGTYYGTLRQSIENDLEKGYFTLLDIDVLGALHVKKIFKESALTIFLAPPSLEVLKQRLLARGSETEDSLATRLKRAKDEMNYSDKFDTLIVNDDLEKAYHQLKLIVTNFLNNDAYAD